MLGERAYSHALSLKNQSSLLFDLGVNLFYQSKVINDPKKIPDILKSSENYFKQAISSNPESNIDRSIYWNGLGVLLKDPSHQQHAFIKSIMCDSKV